MSPATVDVRSPITSSLPRPSSTPQNPDLVPEKPSPSTFNLGASNDNGSQCQFGSTVPSRPARLRPRLVKLRKQHSRSRTGPAESGPGVNPFFSVSDSTNASNGFNFSNGDCQGVGFVFGAKSGVDENLDNREGRSGGVERKLDNGEGGSNETVRTSSCDDNLDNGQGESGEIVKNLSFDEREQSNSGNGIDFDKLESASCEFGARQDNLSSSFWGEKRECGEHERGMVSEDNWDGKKETETGGLKADNLDFSFTATRSDLGLGWDLESKQETRECHGYMEKPSANNSEVKSESAGECNVRSGHGANQRDSAPNSSTENGESASFVFAAGPDGLGSTSNSGNREYSEIEGKSGCDGFGPGFQPNGCVSEAASVSGAKKKDENSFTATPDGFGGCFEDFKPSFWDPSCLRANLFPELNKNSDFSMKGRSVRDRRLRKHKGKSKKPLLTKQGPGQDHVPKENSSKENLDPSGCYSPMDFSPYEETRVTDSHSKETAVASTNATVAFDPKGEDLAASGNRLDDMDDQKSKELIGENSRHHSERIFFHDGFWKGSGSGAETPCFSGIIGADMDSEKARAGIGSNIERQVSDCRTPLFPSDVENMKNKYFTFLALSSVQENSTVAKRQQRRKKNKMKVGHETFVITPSPNVEFGSSDLFSTSMVDKSEADEQFKQVHISSTVATHETCEKWRIRGNEAYKNGDLPKAEDFYTQGIISIPSNERSGCSLKPLLLCYSNRAATRMSLGRIREALGDCMMATALDPNFLKGQMRAANCHLLLGEVENAREYFNKCSESRNGVCLDRRIVIDSADGLQKVQNVVECTNRSAKLLDQRTSDAALAALEIISEALSVSSYSEKLLEMKAEALCLLRRYEEAIQLCEQSLLFAERNFAPLNNVENMDFSGREVCPVVRLWRWFFISKSYFHLGRLEAALDLLEKLEKLGSSKDMYSSKKMESSISLAVTIRELLSHKNAGNEAFRSGRHTEAVEHYTVALSSNTASRPFSAICLCNRGAANQALGQITDAIADCSLAIALDGNYVKAVGRRATLHEMIRDYGQAASDLQRLVSILENQSNDKVKESSSKGRSNGSVKELRSAHKRLPLMEQEAKKRPPLDFYLILGVKSSDASPDIKKAYRKAALKHHPDKAGQFLARSESGDERQVWKEISLEVHKDADRLFKMIGEAYAVLSDPAKRSQYDLEEEMRKVEIESKGSSIYRKSSPNQAPGRNSYGKPDFSSPFERSSNSRNSSREYWRTYGNSYSRW